MGEGERERERERGGGRGREREGLRERVIVLAPIRFLIKTKSTVKLLSM